MTTQRYILCIAEEKDDCSLLHDAVLKLDESIHVKYEFNGFKGIAFLVEALNNGSPLPGLIVIDLNIPATDAKKTFRQIKAIPELKDIPVLFLANVIEDWDVITVEELGATIFQKPYKLKDYINIAETVVRLVD